MFKRLRTFILAGLGTIAICCGAGFSYWFFAETSYRYIKSGAEVEDIYENYNSGKPNPITQYEMYVFPSTWYLSQYKTEADKPELKYGYLERSLNSNNEVVDIYVDPDGGRHKTVDISWTEKYCFDIDNYETEEAADPSQIKTFKHPKNDEKEPLFDEINNLNSLYISNHGSWYNPNYKNDYKRPTITNDKGEKIGFNDYGNPTEDAQDKAGLKQDGLYQETEVPNHNEGVEGKPIYQKLNIDDRLGYWYELDASHGRFLPIKISFSGSLSPQTFQKLVPNPRADMADSNAYHNYVFCNWVYYNPLLDGNNKPYVEPVDGFSNYDRINIFDALLNLEEISYENKDTGKREIRLFPVFSNGKDYPGRISNVSGEYDDNALGQGYRDGLKVEYITKDSDGSIDMQGRYFTFHKGHQNVTYDGTNYNYAKLNNFNTNGKMLEYINFTGVYTHSFYNDPYFGNPYYEKCSYGDWVNFDAKANKSNLQAGDKNIYAISTTQYYGDSEKARIAMQSLVDKMHNKSLGADVNSYKGLFGSLKGRELSAIYNNFTDENKSNIFVVSNNENGQTANQYRAYALFFERILDLKAIAGFPVNDNYITDENYDIYKETSPGALLDFYESEYDNSRNLFTENSAFYVGTKGNGNTFIPESDPPTSVNVNNQFIYKIDSLDLSKDPLKFFNIRIEKYDSSLTKNIKFNLNPLGEQNVDKVLYEGELNANGNGTINGDGSNTFVNGSEYFELIKYRYSSKDDPSMSKDTIGFKLKQNGTSSGLGYYDIVLVYDSSTQEFNVYAYKHKNIFVKIFDQELTTYKDGETQGFINHNPTDVKYYERIYDYNEVISKENEFTPILNGVIAGDKKIIDDVIIEFATIRHNSSTNAGDGTYKDFTGKRSDGTMDTEETYFIVDHVTKSILCKATFDDVNKQFVVIVNQTIDLSVIKNYVLYLITQTQYRSNKYNPLVPYNKPVAQ